MPILPLDHVDPLAATLGIMLYPGLDPDERHRAASFTLTFLAPVISDLRATGRILPSEHLTELIAAAGAPLPDFEDRMFGGTAIGEIFKTFFYLSKEDAKRASWSGSQRIAIYAAGPTHKRRISTTYLKQQRSTFLPVAHLWAAIAIREYRFAAAPSVGYQGIDDFYSFLAEAEILRAFGENWRRPAHGARPPMDGVDVWRPPADWRPPERGLNWPPTGKIPHAQLSSDLLELAQPAGTPRRRTLSAGQKK